MSLASVTAQQNTAHTTTALTASGPPTSGTLTSQTGGTALDSLGSSFNDFLKLLMTQLQNQDPTSPLDTNQFTSELVQFSSVEQQINTNTSLSQLIQLTQAGEVMQGSSMTGKQVTVTSDHVPLQNGKGTVQFTTMTPQPVAVAIYTDAGAKVCDFGLTTTAGVNTWTWNGTDGTGRTLPDGSYKITLIGANPDGSTTAMPFNVIGTATGVQSETTGIELQMGNLTVPFSAVRAVKN